MRKQSNYVQILFIKYIIFLLVLIVGYPIIVFFMQDTSIFSRAFSSFELLKFNLLIAASIGLFLFLGRKKVERFPKNSLKSSVFLIIIALAIFVLSVYPYNNLNSLLNEGIGISQTQNQTNKINFEKNQWLNLWLIEYTTEGKTVFLDGLNYSEKEFRKVVLLKKIPESPKIHWCGSWHGSLFNDGTFNPEVSVFMKVNGEDYNITSNYRGLMEYTNNCMILNVSEEHLNVGRNELIIFAESEGGVGENIGVATQQFFVKEQSSVFNGKEFEVLEGKEFIWYINTKNGFFYKLLFKFSFLLRIASVIILVVGIFGVPFTRLSIKKCKKELFFSTIWIYLLGLFALAINNLEYLLKQLSSFVVYLLLKITGFAANLFIDPSESMIQLGQFQAKISSSSAGGNHIILFLVAFNIFIFTMWEDIKLKKIITYQLWGILGVFMMNVLNLYIQTLVDYYNLQSGGFLIRSLPEILFILFFVVFWYIILNKSEKNGKK